MTIAGVVILYYPGEEILKNISSYVSIVQKLYIVDNSEVKNDALILQLEKIPNTILICDGENKGIAYRLNQVASFAIDENFDFLLTMDQDSFFEDHVPKKYLNCLSNFENVKDVAMFGIEFLNHSLSDNDCNSKQVKELITSGSVVNLELFKTIGGFDEALFIDLVDHEYCYRSLLKGYNLIQFTNIYLNHSLGNTKEKRSLKTLKKTNRNLHTPIRLYYMTRNYLYINAKYKEHFPKLLKKQKQVLKNRIKNNLLYATDKIALAKYILKGWNDFRQNNLGKIKSYK